MIRRVLIDTGPLVAILSRRDQYHPSCTEVLRSLPPPLFTCWPVLTEAAWLLQGRSDLLRRLLQTLEIGLLKLLPLDETAAPHLANILSKYRKLGVQLADACLLHLADREGIDTVFTVDRRDFEVYRLPGNRRLRILPEL